MEPPPPSALSVAGWSATVGSSQSKIIDLLVSAAVNVVAVTGVVMLFALESLPLGVIGGVLLGLATVAVAWLLKREAARLGPLLTAYAGSRLVLLVGVAAAYLARRPDQMTWLWVATGLALLAVLTEPTIKVLLSKTEQVAVNLPGVRPVPAPPFRPDRIAVGSLVVVVVGGVLAATAAPAWLYLSVVLLGFAAVLIIITDVVFFSVVFVFQDNTVESVWKTPELLLPWIGCLMGKTKERKDECLSLADPLVVDTATVGAVLILLAVITAPSCRYLQESL